MVFENKVLRIMYGPKRVEEVRGDWIKLRNKEMYNFYSSSYSIRVSDRRE